MKRSGIIRLAGAATLALGISAAMGMPAQAKGGSTESAHGDCSATSTWKLNASGKKDSITVKAKVATDVAGETWSYTLADNGAPVAAGDATTNKNGKFKAKASIPNLEGTDTLDFTATDSVTGETCVGQVVFEK